MESHKTRGSLGCFKEYLSSLEGVGSGEQISNQEQRVGRATWDDDTH